MTDDWNIHIFFVLCGVGLTNSSDAEHELAIYTWLSAKAPITALKVVIYMYSSGG